ncbi:MAG TPA: hypothetical protein VM073_02840 [Usitatibacter sp.]|nr:hypothetical protein [Usitatibacter sp.]
MASEARRAARALVEHRTESFESRHAPEVARRRLDEALARIGPAPRVVFTPRWVNVGEKAILEASFIPPARIARFLKATSVVMTLLLAATVWAIAVAGAEPALAWLLTLSTGFAILGLPFVFVALGSQREADEGRIRKAIRVALTEE